MRWMVPNDALRLQRLERVFGISSHRVWLPQNEKLRLGRVGRRLRMDATEHVASRPARSNAHASRVRTRAARRSFSDAETRHLPGEQAPTRACALVPQRHGRRPGAARTRLRHGDAAACTGAVRCRGRAGKPRPSGAVSSTNATGLRSSSNAGSRTTDRHCGSCGVNPSPSAASPFGSRRRSGREPVALGNRNNRPGQFLVRVRVYTPDSSPNWPYSATDRRDFRHPASSLSVTPRTRKMRYGLVQQSVGVPGLRDGRVSRRCTMRHQCGQRRVHVEASRARWPSSFVASGRSVILDAASR